MTYGENKWTDRLIDFQPVAAGNKITRYQSSEDTCSMILDVQYGDSDRNVAEVSGKYVVVLPPPSPRLKNYVP